MRRKNKFKNSTRDGDYYIICDVCGFKIRRRDAVLITDKFNFLNGMLVCKKDADETNPQARPHSPRDRQTINPKFTRPERTDQYGYIDTPDQIETGDTSDPALIVNNPPRHFSILNASSDTVEIQWMTGEPGGTSNTSGWKVERETGIGGGFSTLTSSTQSVAMYYKDINVSAGTVYNYRISAVSAAGTGNPSEEFAVTTSS